ncbi:MAG: metal-sensing transcriptional repressor [Spirochaetes bacterium]|nr:metal-sensing transcriptional repressor [Spirochaetota bacterium]
MDRVRSMDKCRKAHHSEEFKEGLAKRLDRIEGQIRGIKKMIQEDRYCDHILNQLTAVRSALASVQEQLLLGHMHTCVLDQLREGDLGVIEELSSTIRRMIR